MPIHEYICENCLYVFEALQRQPEVDDMRCPRCGAAGPERLISRPGRVGARSTSSSCGTFRPIG